MKDGWTHVDNKESACFCLKCIFMAYGLQCELYQQITVGMKHDGTFKHVIFVLVFGAFTS